MASNTKAEPTANPKKYVRPLFEVESLQLTPHPHYAKADFHLFNYKMTNLTCGKYIIRDVYPFSMHVVTFNFITNLMHLFN